LTYRLNLIFLSRHEDPLIRDEMVELLLNAAALGGNSLGSAAVPARTQIKSWCRQKPKAPERRIALGQCAAKKTTRSTPSLVALS